jgi:hypothetical protein
MEMAMSLRLFIVLACALLAVSACIVAPFGSGGGHGGYHGGGGGGGEGHGEGYHDYGRRVWH